MVMGAIDKYAPGRTPVASIGPRMQRAGGGILNKTVGATAKDLSRGANPGEAYLAGGGRPALTMGGLSRQAIGEPDSPIGGIVGRTGKQLGNIYQSATENGVRFSPSEVRSELEKPLGEYEAGLEGPGGTGAGPTLDEYRSRLGTEGRPEFLPYSPNELFNLKHSIAGQSRWNPLEPVGLNSVRQEQVGRLGGMLTDKVPGAAPLNKIYQGGLRFGNRALQRSLTGQSTVSQVARRGMEAALGAGLGYATGHPAAALIPLLADSVPVRSAAAWSLYHGGAASPTLMRLTPLVGPASALSRVNNKKPEEEDNKQK